MRSGDVRHTILSFILLGSIVVCTVTLTSCKSGEDFPIPTLVKKLAESSPPSLPFNPIPPHEAIDISRSVVFNWQVTELDGEEVFYDVFLGLDTTFTISEIRAEGQSENFLQLSQNLGANTQYFWKVDVRDASDNWRFGDIWSFTTGSELGNPPFVTIFAPTDESIFTIGDLITFRGFANDTEDDTLSGGKLIWSSNINGPFGIDSVVVSSVLEAGIHTIILSATDNDDKTTSESVIITVNDPSAGNIAPSVTIESPARGTTFGEEETITFRGAGRDIEDGELPGESLTWISSIDDVLGSGTELQVSGLTLDTHTITLRATDSGGLTRETQIQISVDILVNAPPEAQIITPVNNSSFAESEVINFFGSASDPDGDNVTVSWSSDSQGQLGTATQLNISSLQIGTHIITFRAEDPSGVAGTDQITINVTPVGADNQPPVADIQQPVDEQVFNEGLPVQFLGSGTDPEDGTILSFRLGWSSDRSGNIGTGESVFISSLPRGKHIISLIAEDSGGKKDTATVTIFVNGIGNMPPVARFSMTQTLPPQDPNTIALILDAGSVYDAVDAAAGIEVKWDFDNNGIFDTEFTNEKTATFSYTSKNKPHFIRMLARDSGGSADEVVLIVPEHVFVPASDFNMGDSASDQADEQPRHTVFIDDYYIGRFEVTNAQFAQFMTDNSATAGQYFSSRMSIFKPEEGIYIALEGFENYPVRYVEWQAAESYSSWIQGRLPTEAEWEKAARGGIFLGEGNTDPNLQPNRQYPWGAGGLSLNHANYLISGRPFDGLAPTGMYTGHIINTVQTINNSSPYGVFDMLGNIAEWVSDWYQPDYYASSPATNPTGPSNGSLKVIRGGSFDHIKSDILITRRFQALPTTRPFNVGLRTVITK